MFNIKKGSLAKVVISKDSRYNIFFRNYFSRTLDQRIDRPLVGAWLTHPPDYDKMIPVENESVVLVLEEIELTYKILHKNRVCYINQNFLVNQEYLFNE